MKKQLIFTIPVSGFNQRPNKNPLGYTRTTQRGAKFDPKAKLYEAWKDYVWNCCGNVIMESDINCRPETKQKVKIDIMIFYKNDAKSDASNIFKGIEDALADKKAKVAGKMRVIEERLYVNDNYCIGSFNFAYDSVDPRVEVIISW